MTDLVQEKQLKGFSGWLVLPAFGTCVSPLIIMSSVYDEYQALMDLISTRFVWLGVVSVALCVIHLVISLAALYFMIKKDRRYPMTYVAMMLFAVLYSLLMVVWVSSYNIDTSEIAKGMARAIGISSVWVPYMLVSKRVKNTFIN